MEQAIVNQLKENIKVKEQIIASLAPKIAEIAKVIINSLKTGGKVILFGNGGSAADAQHLAAEFVNKFTVDRSPLPALALTTNTSILTAIANDHDYKSVFSRQVEAWTRPEDAVIAFSTSGTSENVIEGIETANQKGSKTISFTGAGDTPLSELAQICLKIPSTNTPQIQEAHITVGHIICGLVEEALFTNNTTDSLPLDGGG